MQKVALRVCEVYEASDQDDQHGLYFLRVLKLVTPYRAPYHDGEHERHGLQCGGLADEQRLEHILAHHAEEAGHEEGARDLHGMCMVCAWSAHGIFVVYAWIFMVDARRCALCVMWVVCHVHVCALRTSGKTGGVNPRQPGLRAGDGGGPG